VKTAAIPAAILAILAALATGARADTPRTTISIEPRAFAAHGLALELERDLPAQRISVVGAASLRATASGDYHSTSAGVGAEVRYCRRRKAIWTRRPAGSAIGWYVAARLDLERTSLRDGMDESVGAMSTIAGAALVGYRFAPWRGLEIRPYAGLAGHTDTGGGLPSWHRASIGYGVSLGWTF
jgi:hypothetical protein